jgi:hypothetical protein
MSKSDQYKRKKFLLIILILLISVAGTTINIYRTFAKPVLAYEIEVALDHICLKCIEVETNLIYS